MQIYLFNSYDFTTSYGGDKQNVLYEINEYSFLSYL